MSRASDANDAAIIEALSGDALAATREWLVRTTDLTQAQVRASLRRLRDTGVVTTSQNMQTRAVRHFLSERRREAIAVTVGRASGEGAA